MPLQRYFVSVIYVLENVNVGRILYCLLTFFGDNVHERERERTLPADVLTILTVNPHNTVSYIFARHFMICWA